MPRLIDAPVVIPAAGTRGKQIEEFVGRVSTGHEQLSVARMVSPAGWSEPPQCPDFREITVVLRGNLHVEHDGQTLVVSGGQAVITQPGETVRYCTPDAGGAEYIAICLPAFSPDTVHRQG